MKSEYSQEDFNAVEKELHNRILDYAELPKIQNQLSEAYYIWLNNPDIIIDYINEEEIDDETFSKFFDWFIYDFRLIDYKETIIERFSKEEQLSEVEELIIKEWIKSAASFFEIITIEQNKQCVVKDLFTNNQFLILDKNASNSLKLTDLIYARPIKTGNNYYFSGIISIFPQILRKNIVQSFNKEYSEYKKQGISTDITHFLKERSFLLYKTVEDLINHPQYLTQSGDEFLIAKAHYEIIDKSDLIENLETHKDLEKISKNGSDIVIFAFKGKKSDSYIEIEDNELVIETNSERELKLSKKTVEKILKLKINHKKDIIRNLESYIGSNENSSTVHDEDLENYYNEWIHTPNIKLNGKTPIEALTLKTDRDKLELLLKELEKLFEDSKKHGEPHYEVNKIREMLKKAIS